MIAFLFCKSHIKLFEKKPIETHGLYFICFSHSSATHTHVLKPISCWKNKPFYIHFDEARFGQTLLQQFRVVWNKLVCVCHLTATFSLFFFLRFIARKIIDKNRGDLYAGLYNIIRTLLICFIDTTNHGIL